MIEGQKWAANLWVWNGPRYGLSSVDPETGRTVDKVVTPGGQEVEADPTFTVRKSTRPCFVISPAYRWIRLDLIGIWNWNGNMEIWGRFPVVRCGGTSRLSRFFLKQVWC